jgi:hypothetical protein
MTEIPRFAWFATLNKGASSVRHSGESDGIIWFWCVNSILQKNSAQDAGTNGRSKLFFILNESIPL